jgi:hypothetical protein
MNVCRCAHLRDGGIRLMSRPFSLAALVFGLGFAGVLSLTHLVPPH